MDAKTLIAMRDEMERIQGGVGLSPDDRKLQYISDTSSEPVAEQPIISSSMFGENGPSLANAAQIAMTRVAGEHDG